ncbi:MAG: S-layer homology domain-containing protein [Peptococcaceae bacterium]|nr:S-layer homology domain-containing protein [Peptococcaceae bacterium]
MLKRKSKRVLSIVLAVAMIAGLFPIAAFAEGGEPATPVDQNTKTVATKLPGADENGVITLKEDTTITTLTLNSTGKTVIDLNGHTLTYNSKLAIKIGDGQTLSFIDSSDSGAERGGTLALTGVTGASAAINPQKGGTVNAENINISCTGSAFFPQGEKATVNINNCALTAEAYCVATNSGAQDNFGVKISIANSELTSKQACAVMLNIPGTLDMNNCTVTGSSQAVMVRAGKASISNCALSLDGKTTDKYNPKEDWKSGTQNVPIAALVVGSQTGSETAYAADAVCNVTNTTISASGENANGAVYVSSNKDKQAGNFKSQLNISGEKSTVNGDIVVADGKSDKSNPSSVVISDNAQVTGNITNDSAFSSVALINGATLEGDVTSDATGASNVFVENRDNTNSKVVALNVTTGRLYSDLATAVSEAQNGETVQLLKDITINATNSTPVSQGVINILSNITLDGNGKTITAGTGFDYNTSGTRGEHHVIAVMDPATNVVIKDLTIDGSNNTSTTPKNGARSGINVWSDDQKINVTVENVSVKNCSTYGLTVTKGDVTIDGLTTENNVWGGINADNKQGDANLIVNNANLSENSSIVFDKGGTGKITATINGGSFRDVVMGKDANEKPITTIDSLRINGGTFKTAGIANAIDVEDYLAPGLVYNPYTGQVYKEPEYTGKYSYEIFTKVGDNGTISVDRYATEGDNVTITVSPDEAYLLDELTVTANGKEVEVKDNGDGTYTFKMPSADAKIVVTFAEDPDWEPEPEEPAMPFTDVNEGDWFYDVVLYAYDNGLMTGVSATEFAPNQTTTRGMIVSMLARLEGVTSAEDAGFADVAANDWYATAVNWAASVGVVNGYEDDTFRPNAPITREQMAAILYNYADYKGYDVSARADLSDYADAASISSWAEDVLAWANAEGLINGMTATTIDPQGATTRAQTAAMFERFLTAHEA